MKNIQIIDGALNCVYDIFASTPEEFSLIFPDEQDIAFIDDVYAREASSVLDEVFANIWKRRITKSLVKGIHGTLFYGLEHKKVYYPTRRDDDARNANGSHLR